MHYYVPHYDDKTAIKYGELASGDTVSARSQLLRERGGHCVTEVWRANKGYVPLYEFTTKLSNDECQVLCLCPDERGAQVTPTPHSPPPEWYL